MDSDSQISQQIMCEHDQNSSQTVSYIDYKDLTPTTTSPQDLIVQVQNTHWRNQFQALNGFRALRKFNTEDWEVVQDQIISFALPLVNSLRSNLSKNALTLLAEMFLQPNEAYNAHVSEIVPVVILKAVSDKAFIRREADLCLRNMATKAVSEELVSALRTECSNRAAQVAEAAFKYLRLTFDSQPVSMQMDLCFDLFDSKRSGIRNKIVEQLRKHRDSPEFSERLEQCDTTKQTLITKAIEGKKSRGGFRDFIKQKKQNQDDTEVFELAK